MTIPVSAGDEICFRGDNIARSFFSGTTSSFNVKGNIMSIVNSTDYLYDNSLTSQYAFTQLFANCTGLTSAKDLILPATSLTH